MFVAKIVFSIFFARVCWMFVDLFLRCQIGPKLGQIVTEWG